MSTEHMESRDEWRRSLEHRAAVCRAYERQVARQASWLALSGLALAGWTWWRCLLVALAQAGWEGLGVGILGVLVALWTLLGCFWLLASAGGDPRSRLALALVGVLWISGGLLMVLLGT